MTSWNVMKMSMKRINNVEVNLISPDLKYKNGHSVQAWAVTSEVVQVKQNGKYLKIERQAPNFKL